MRGILRRTGHQRAKCMRERARAADNRPFKPHPAELRASLDASGSSVCDRGVDFTIVEHQRSDCRDQMAVRRVAEDGCHHMEGSEIFAVGLVFETRQSRMRRSPGFAPAGSSPRNRIFSLLMNSDLFFASGCRWRRCRERTTQTRPVRIFSALVHSFPAASGMSEPTYGALIRWK